MTDKPKLSPMKIKTGKARPKPGAAKIKAPSKRALAIAAKFTRP